MLLPAAPPSLIKRVAVQSLIFLGGFSIVAGAFYFVGKSQASTDVASTDASHHPTFELPQGAIKLLDCLESRGAQFVMPDDIPLGPIYNMWNGEITGITYMINENELSQDKVFDDLRLESMDYDHVDISRVVQGHAGFAQNHYHLFVSAVPKTVTDQIHCSVMEQEQMLPETEPTIEAMDEMHDTMSEQ